MHSCTALAHLHALLTIHGAGNDVAAVSLATQESASATLTAHVSVQCAVQLTQSKWACSCRVTELQRARVESFNANGRQLLPIHAPLYRW